MKIPVKKSCSLLILMIAFALTLSVAGDALASPCLHLDLYNNPDGSGGKYSCEGLAVPYFGTNQEADTEVYFNNRLWFGTDTNWNWQGSNLDYKAVLVGYLINNNGSAGTGEVQLVYLHNVNGLNNSGTLEVFNPVTNALFATTPVGTSTIYDFMNVSFTMEPGVYYPFRVMYSHFSGEADGFDFRLLAGKESIPENCPPQQVAEPSTMLLLGFGVIGLGVAGRRKFGK